MEDNEQGNNERLAGERTRDGMGWQEAGWSALAW